MPGAKIDLLTIRKRNQAALKKLENGGRSPYVYTLYGGKALLIIGKIDPEIEHALRGCKPYVGTVEVTKGSLTDPGQLKFTGVPANRHELETELKQFTKKKVVYA